MRMKQVLHEFHQPGTIIHLLQSSDMAHVCWQRFNSDVSVIICLRSSVAGTVLPFLCLNAAYLT